MGLIERFIDRGPQETSVTEKRLRNIPTDDLATWVDNTISQVGRSSRNYLITGELEHLDEARIGVESLNAMIQELRRRAE